MLCYHRVRLNIEQFCVKYYGASLDKLEKLQLGCWLGSRERLYGQNWDNVTIQVARIVSMRYRVLLTFGRIIGVWFEEFIILPKTLKKNMA